MTRERAYLVIVGNPHTIEPETQKSYNKKRYYRIMRALELKAVIRRKRHST
ncbi:hypothetical protein P7H16_11335 [Paenibacillus larvae]|nr:hypothetical protein [Paenibacillus larvae]MDT2247400.1 hypothetical protein [Paenibacillus larvae]